MAYPAFPMPYIDIESIYIVRVLKIEPAYAPAMQLVCTAMTESDGVSNQTDAVTCILQPESVAKMEFCLQPDHVNMCKTTGSLSEQDSSKTAAQITTLNHRIPPPACRMQQCGQALGWHSTYKCAI